MDLSKYTFFIFLSDLVYYVNSNVDKLLLGRIMGTIAVAVYSVGYTLNNYYATMTWVVPEMYIPAVNRAAVADDSATVNALFVKIGRINNYLTLLVISGFLLFGQCFIRLWVGEEYSEAFYAACILFASGYIPAVQTLGVNVQNAKNMHQVRSVVYFVIMCANVVLSIFLIHRWGVIGTCLGTLFACLIGQGLFMNIYYHKKIGLNIIAFWVEMSKWYPFVFVLGICAVFVLRRVTITTWPSLFAAIGVYTAVYAVLLAAFGLNRDERMQIKEKIGSILCRG